MAKKSKAGITDQHYLDLGQASGAQTTLTAYGKLIKNTETAPSTVGISHPHGISDPLQASLVFGVAMGGRCISLPSPRQVMLPAPDGPADGCGWDPAEYLVWKNLPRQWVTVQFQTTTRTLSDALLGSLPSQLGTPPLAMMGVRDRVVEIVKSWAKMATDPKGNDQLQVLWANSDPASSFADGATILARLLKDAFGIDFQGSNFAPPDKIKTVDDVVAAVT